MSLPPIWRRWGHSGDSSDPSQYEKSQTDRSETSEYQVSSTQTSAPQSSPPKVGLDGRKVVGQLEQLCPRCAAIDLELMLDPTLKIPQEGYSFMSLGRPNSKEFSNLCPLCQLFLSVATKYKGGKTLELRLYEQARLPLYTGKKWSWDLATVISTEASQRFLTVVRKSSRVTFAFGNAHEVGMNGLLIPVTPTCRHACSVYTAKPDTIHYDLLKSWLRNCADTHGSSCTLGYKSEIKVQLYAIDCSGGGKIVQLSQTDQYVALSYVWGKQHRSSQQQGKPAQHLSAPLPAEVPLTISDAMRAVSSIGYRYLWVDRYCIPQTDLAERQKAISNMDQIYAGAEVTFVALHGDNDGAGLPGVSSTPRTSLEEVLIQEGRIVPTRPPLSTALGQSVWGTRGWTYQEARLSRRCLFFSSHQVYFSCNKYTLSEAIPHEPSTSSVAKHLNSRGLGPQTFSFPHDPILQGFLLDRQIFSRRDLTFQNDTLDAFRGILNVHPFSTIFGVPAARSGWQVDPHVCFSMGLCWRRRPSWQHKGQVQSAVGSPYRRRKGFPTWSWTSMRGEIFQLDFGENSFYRSFFHEISSAIDLQPKGIVASFSVKLPEFDLSLPEALAMCDSQMLSEAAPSLFLTGDIVRVKPTGKKDDFYFSRENDEAAVDKDISAYFDTDYAQEFHDANLEMQDALVLIEWNDEQPESKRRFILMLLRWVEEGVAERVGLLGDYFKHWDVDFLNSLSRRRAQFELR